ncbi:MAG: hypothetical protein QW597_00390 [Thermoplasmataceae archaeon]
MSEIIDFSKQQTDTFVVIDLKAVITELQVRIAVERATRRLAYSSRIHDFGSLVMMYITGSPQIVSALHSAGISKNTKKAIVICSSPSEFYEFLERFSGRVGRLQESPLVYDDQVRDRDTLTAMSNVDYEI